MIILKEVQDSWRNEGDVLHFFNSNSFFLFEVSGLMADDYWLRFFQLAVFEELFLTEAEIVAVWFSNKMDDILSFEISIHENYLPLIFSHQIFINESITQIGSFFLHPILQVFFPKLSLSDWVLG